MKLYIYCVQEGSRNWEYSKPFMDIPIAKNWYNQNGKWLEKKFNRKLILKVKTNMKK